MIARLPGVSSAPPIPCRIRAAISQPIDGASPHNNDASANQATPTTNTRRRPKRSPKAPANRISEANANRYPVSTHCSDATPACRDRPMCGTATLTMVPSSIAIPDAATVAARAIRPRVDRRVSPASDGASAGLISKAALDGVQHGLVVGCRVAGEDQAVELAEDRAVHHAEDLLGHHERVAWAEEAGRHGVLDRVHQ